MSDENIRQVVRDLHDHSWHDGETQEAYQDHKVASTHIHRNSEAVENVPKTEITQKDDILEDLSQLYAEQVEHNTEQIWCDKEGDIICRSFKGLQDVSLTGKEVHGQEHYHEWLATQNILNNMRNDDIRAMGNSNIPGLVIQGIMTGMPPLDLAIHIMKSMSMMTMVMIMIIVIVI